MLFILERFRLKLTRHRIQVSIAFSAVTKLQTKTD